MLSSLNDRQVTMASLVTSVGLLCIGLYMFFERAAYAETGTGWLAIGYVVMCFFAFFTIRLRMLVLSILCLCALVVIQSYAFKKYEWRRIYVESASNGQPFMAEAYIDQYPTYEQQLKARLFREANWVDFSNDCLLPLSQDAKPDVRCSNPALIESYYALDLNSALTAYFDKMKATAIRIKDGELKTKAELQQCIADKQCALVPLLPPDVDANAISPTSVEYMAIRRAFWSVINDTRIKPEVCDYILLCKAMVQLRLMDPADTDPR